MSLSRRVFVLGSPLAGHMAGARAAARRGTQYRISEWSVSSAKPYRDPFNEVELDFIFRNSSGTQWRVPAFWAGEQDWTIRFAPPAPGVYQFESVCSETGNFELHGVKGSLEVE